jgi:FkbM family methyltransferase
LTLTSNEDAQRKVLDLCELYYSLRKSNPEIVLLNDFSEIDPAAKPEWIDQMLKKQTIHDDDYVVFKYLQDPDATVLDIGANWGYSAGEFIKLGVKAKIVSFEVVPMFAGALGRLREIYPNQYHFFISGLGNAPAVLQFVVPVVNRKANFALCSAAESPILKSLANNIVNNANRLGGGKIDKAEISFLEFTAPISTLDSFVPEQLPENFRNPVEAIKIDVEGLEASVLKGAARLIKKHRPLILAEGANRGKEMRELMLELGYVFAERSGSQLEICDGVGKHASGFFMHEDRQDYYRQIGVLKS